MLPCSRQSYSQAKMCKNLQCPLTDEGESTYGIFIQGAVLSLKKEGTSAGCGNTDGPAGHYANGTKSDRGTNTAGLHLQEAPKQKNSWN